MSFVLNVINLQGFQGVAQVDPRSPYRIGLGVRLLPRTLQRVEKVGVELVATTNRAQNAPILAFSYPIWGESEHQGSFSTACLLPGTSVNKGKKERTPPGGCARIHEKKAPQPTEPSRSRCGASI